MVKKFLRNEMYGFRIIKSPKSEIRIHNSRYGQNCSMRNVLQFGHNRTIIPRTLRKGESTEQRNPVRFIRRRRRFSRRADNFCRENKRNEPN